MKSIACDNLRKMKAAEIKQALTADRVSVLVSLGARLLRAEMTLVGWACRLMVFLIFFFGRHQAWRRKRRAAWWVRLFFPVKVRKMDYRPVSGRAIIVYFNHQSLFEVLATIWWCLKNLPERNYLFPVNLPWYEALCPVLEKLRQIGITLTPMITPSTRKKLLKIVGDDAEKIDVIAALKLQFEREFGELHTEFSCNCEVIAVAPSATRTGCIFSSYGAFLGEDLEALKQMPRTLSAMCMQLMRNRLKSLPLDLVPLVATRKKRAGRGLNIRRWHDVYVGAADSLEVAMEKLEKRTLDFYCYHRLAEFVPDEVKYDHHSA